MHLGTTLATGTIALSALVTGGWLLFSEARSRPAPTPATPPAALGIDPQSRSKLTAVEQQLSALRAELASLKSTPAPTRADNPITDEATTSPTIPATLPPVPTTPEELHARLDLAFADEPLDTAWARAEERSIADFVSRAAPSAQLEELECRSEMCRIKLKFESERAMGDFRASLGAPPLDNGGFYHVEDTRFTYFAPRKGHGLPLAALE